MKKINKYTRWYRRPKTTAERRANCKTGDIEDTLYRGCRGHKNLPTTYDDIPVKKNRRVKTWKVKRQQQYRLKDKPLKEYKYITKEWSEMWKLVSYLEDNDIPHKLKEKRHVANIVRYQYRTYGPISIKPRYIHNSNGNLVQSGYITEYGYIPLKEPKRISYKVGVTDEYCITWKWHSDIFIEKIIASP